MIDILGTAKFIVRRRLKGFDISDKPHFDEASSAYFCQRLRGARLYLEYGSGGSTVEAARQGKQFVTVESDPHYLAAVQAKIGSAPGGKLIHADIGMTGPWGVPLFQKPTAGRVERWSRYPKAPWEFLPQPPDLILIDGRFRASCAVIVAERLNDSSFELLFDDYLERRHHFSPIEAVLDLKGFKGRMAIFGPKKHSTADINELKRRFAADYN